MKKQLKEHLADAEKPSPGLTVEQLSFLNKEHRKHVNGETKSYSWEEVKDMIRKRKAS